jgi:hypothetical protein
MNYVAICLSVVAALHAATAAAQAPARAESNEVFYTDKDGAKRVVLPPAPMGFSGKPQPRPSKPLLIAEGAMVVVYMIETESGLVECSDMFRSTCRPSTYGIEKRWRNWLVRRGGLWLTCNGPERSAQCVASVGLNGPKGERDWTKQTVPTRIH